MHGDGKGSGGAGPLDELIERARKELAGELAPNYTAEELARDAGHGQGHEHGVSVRRAEHRGRTIVVETHYRITVDGEPLEIGAMVDDAGRVHSHGLPNYAYASMIDLVKRVLDAEAEGHVDDRDASPEPEGCA